MNKKEKFRVEICLIVLFGVVAFIVGNSMIDYSWNEELEVCEEAATIYMFGVIIISLSISGVLTMILHSFIFRKGISEEVAGLKFEELLKKKIELGLDIKLVKEKKELLEEINKEIRIRESI